MKTYSGILLGTIFGLSTFYERILIVAIRRLYLYFAIVLLFGYGPLKSQLIKRLNHTSFNLEEGLLHSQVIDLAEDGNGFIWISTGNGIQRFDGRTFHKISTGSKYYQVPDDKYVRFFKLKNGNIWFKHQKGISEYNIQNNRFTSVWQTQSHLADIIPLPLIEMEDGVWCLVKKNSIYKIDRNTYRITDSIPFTTNFDPVNLPPGNKFFVQLTSQEILVWNPLAKKSYLLQPGIHQKYFYASDYYRGDTILVPTTRGIEKIDMLSGRSVIVCNYKTLLVNSDMQQPVRLKKITEDLYIVSEGNQLFELDLKSGTHTVHLNDRRNRPFLNVGYFTKIILDGFNNLWLTSENTGICKINYSINRFKYFGAAEKEKNFVKSIYADKTDNRVLCGTFERGLLIFDTLQNLLRNLNNFPGAPAPYTVCAIRKISSHEYLLLLMGKWNIYKLNTRDYTLKQIKVTWPDRSELYPLDYHLSLFRLNDSTDLLQTGLGAYIFNISGNKIIARYQYEFSPASTSGYLDKQKRLWAGAIGSYFISEKDYTRFRKIDLPEKIIVRCFLQDRTGRTWMGTEKGLYHMDAAGKIIKIFHQADGLADENIYAIREDRKGNLWLSHNKGISCMHVDGSFLHYNKNDGLQENEFNTNTFFESPDGELYFGGVNGVSSFYPHSIIQSVEQPKLLVTSIRVKEVEWESDTAVWNVQQIKLPYYNNNFSFEFTALGSRQPQQYNYQFRMQGAGESWINSGNQGTARYLLSPGKYILELFAGNRFEKDAAAVKKIIITIEPPFWKTIWFISLVSIILAALTIFITRYLAHQKLKHRIEELERKRALDEERLRISREMHDDIGAGLTQITMMSEASKGKVLEDYQLDKIANASRKLVSDMSEIIWSMNPEQNTLDQLLAYLREQLHELLEYAGIEYKIDFPENGSTIFLNNAQKRNLLLVAKEIVHNAVKHSKAKYLSVLVEQKKSSLVFTITDDGCGFDAGKSSHGNGLRNIKRRIEELGGVLNVQTSSSGTTLGYEVPL